MNCNLCGTNEATIHLTEIVNDQMVEIHLCESCAQEKGTDFKTHFNLGDIFAGLTDLGKAEKVREKQETVQCSSCGLTYEGFAKSGRLGCPDCYKSFSKMLMPLIKRVQRAVHHLGKKPSKIARDVRSTHDLRLLQEQLRKSVQMEEYEEAARLRDEIKKTQEKNRQTKKQKGEKKE